jgi:hypothetical protein
MDIVGISGLVVGIVGTSFGFYQYVKSRKLAEVLKTITQTFPGEVAKIEQSCKWAWNHTRNSSKIVATLPNSEEKTILINALVDGNGDAVASMRLCQSLFNQLLAFQQAQFSTRQIIHPEKENLELCQMEMKSV